MTPSLHLIREEVISNIKYSSRARFTDRLDLDYESSFRNTFTDLLLAV